MESLYIEVPNGVLYSGVSVQWSPRTVESLVESPMESLYSGVPSGVPVQWSPRTVESLVESPMESLYSGVPNGVPVQWSP